MAETKVTPVRVPADLLAAVDRRVGPRRRSAFIVEAVRRELTRRDQVDALSKSAGAWHDEDHPELPDTVEGMAAFLRNLRTRAEPSDPSQRICSTRTSSSGGRGAGSAR
jgi:hypothetical protein